MKKIIAFVLFVAMALPLVSCSDKNREYDRDEVIAAAKELIQKSEVLNEIYWGTGIGYDEDETRKNGFYYPASESELERLGVESIDSLKRKTLEVFTIGYAESIFSTALSSIGDEDTGILGYTRYFQYNDTVMVFSKFTPYLTDEVTYLYDTVDVKEARAEVVYVTVSANIKRGDLSQTREIEIGLIEQENGWRIDTPTYMVYRED